jgi:hypothetical protein
MKLHNEELHDLYSLLSKYYKGDQTRRLRWVGHVAYILKNTTVYGVLVAKHERKRPLGRPKHRQKDNVKAHHT